MPLRAFQYDTTIGPDGKVELSVPLALGTAVQVVILTPDHDEFDDLVHASVTSTDFWDNPLDDEDWNDA